MHSPPLRLQTSKAIFQPAMCESIITVFFLKEEAEVREDLLSSPRGTRVHSRHYLLNRPVRECLVISNISVCDV